MKKSFSSLLAISIIACFSLASVPQEDRFPVPKTYEELKEIVENQIAQITGRAGIFIKYLESGETLGFNENERFQLASVFKIPVLLTLYKQIHLGKISLDDRIVFKERMKTIGGGLMVAMKPGLAISIQDLQLLMMARSDNTATDILFDLVTPQAIADFMTELGLKSTTIDYNCRQVIQAHFGLDPAKHLTITEFLQIPESYWVTKECLEIQKAFDTSEHNTSTPIEIGLLLEKCVKGEIVDRATSDQILETMKHHTGAELITRYLPLTTQIARKGGSLGRWGEYSIILDSGIVWLPDQAGPLIFCLWADGLNEPHYDLKRKFGIVARAAYDYFLDQGKKNN